MQCSFQQKSLLGYWGSKFCITPFFLANKRKKSFSKVLNGSLLFCSQKHPATLYTCDVCQKSFPLRCNLLYHQRTHTGEKPYFCEQCGKAFAVKGRLSTHIRGVHKQLRPHQCDKCSVSCLQMSSLRIHMRTHTGEKPFSCVVCGKSFTRKGDCKWHQKQACGTNAEPLMST